jgi:hypothetical protein
MVRTENYNSNFIQNTCIHVIAREENAFHFWVKTLKCSISLTSITPVIFFICIRILLLTINDCFILQTICMVKMFVLKL